MTRHYFTSLIVIAATCLSACASLNSVSLTQIPEERKHRVHAESSRIIVLGLNFDNDFVDDVSDDLKRSCKGKITGILTKDEVINYFLFIVYKRRIEATGFCQKG